MRKQLGAARCLTLWLAGTGALILSQGLALDAARETLLVSGPLGFSQLLSGLAAVVLSCASAWLWTVCSLVIWGALRGRTAHQVTGCPASLRRWVLVGCGVLLSQGPLGAAVAADRPPRGADHIIAGGSTTTTLAGLDGLPLPVRPVSSGPAQTRSAQTRSAQTRSAQTRPGQTRPSPTPASAAVLVTSGDTLWGLAADALGRDASTPEITEEWHRIYAANRAVIGPDPDRLSPGMRLLLPPLPPPPPDQTASPKEQR